MAPKIIKSAKFEDGSYAIEAPRLTASGDWSRSSKDSAPLSEAQQIIQAAEAEAARVLAAAQDQAAEILEKAQVEAQQEAQAIARRAKEQAIADGLRMGIESGQQEVLEQFATHLQNLQQAHDDAQRQRDARLLELEQDLLELSITIAQKLVAVELGHSRGAAAAMVRSAVQHLSERHHVRARVHPLDLPLLTQAKQSIVDAVDGLNSLELIPDTRLGLGGCVLETATGTIDARLSTQLREIAFQLLNSAPTIDDGTLPVAVQIAIEALGPSPLGESARSPEALVQTIPAETPAPVMVESVPILSAQPVTALPEPVVLAHSTPVVVTIEPQSAVLVDERLDWDEEIEEALPPAEPLIETLAPTNEAELKKAADELAWRLGQKKNVLDEEPDEPVTLEAASERLTTALNKRSGKGLRGLKPRSG